MAFKDGRLLLFFVMPVFGAWGRFLFVLDSPSWQQSFNMLNKQDGKTMRRNCKELEIAGFTLRVFCALPDHLKMIFPLWYYHAGCTGGNNWSGFIFQRCNIDIDTGLSPDGGAYAHLWQDHLLLHLPPAEQQHV
eukprot:2037514-Amphidinium_carterae.1